MIITLEEARLWCRIESDTEDMLVVELIEFAEEYLYNATGIRFDATNNVAKQFCKALICEQYEERTLTVDRRKDYSKVLQSCLSQLSHCYTPPEVME